MDNKIAKFSLAFAIAAAVMGLLVWILVGGGSKKYDKGSYGGSTLYTNTWAGVQVKIPSDYQLSKSDSYDTAKETYKAFVKGAKTTSLSYFAIYTRNENMSVDDCLKEGEQYLTGGYFGVSGLSIVAKEKTTRKIAGKTYKVLPLEITYGTFKLYYNVYARKVNRNGMIMFLVGETSQEGIDKVLGFISKK